MKVEAATLDSIGEIVNIGLGKAAELLNTMLDSHVRLRTLSLSVQSPAELLAFLRGRGPSSIATVEMDFSGDFAGSAELIFGSEAANKLVDRITSQIGGSGGDLDAIRSGTLCEVGNIVINGILGTVVNILHAQLAYTVPIYRNGSPSEIFGNIAEGSDLILMASTRFELESLEVDGDILLFLSFTTFSSLEQAVTRFAHA